MDLRTQNATLQAKRKVLEKECAETEETQRDSVQLQKNLIIADEERSQLFSQNK